MLIWRSMPSQFVADTFYVCGLVVNVYVLTWWSVWSSVHLSTQHTPTWRNLLQFIADSFYVRGLASKFVHLFISTLHFPNQVSWNGTNVPPSLGTNVIVNCLRNPKNKYHKRTSKKVTLSSVSIIVIIITRQGQQTTKISFAPGSLAMVLPVSTISSYLMRWDMISEKNQNFFHREIILGWQDARWGVGCCEAFPWSLWSYWWCGL